MIFYSTRTGVDNQWAMFTMGVTMAIGLKCLRHALDEDIPVIKHKLFPFIFPNSLVHNDKGRWNP